MADTEIIEADEETGADAEAEAAGGGLVRKLAFGGGAAVLLAVGIAAGPVIQNMMNPADDAADAADAEQPPVAAVQPLPDSDEPALYAGLHPAMVVNFQDATGDTHFMQLEIEVMARDQRVIDAIKEHAPVIRNNLILLYGNVDYDAIRTRAGKEKMLADGLAEVQDVLAARIGTPGVEALYFTNLIIQ